MPFRRIRLPDIQFQFAQVEQALAGMHRIATERRSAFQGRLKHYQKQGFPAGINTGRGRAATYYVSHAAQLSIALEMNQVGLIPERAIHLCTLHSSRIQGAISLAITHMMTDDRDPVLIAFDPIALSDLRGEEEWDETEATFDVIGIEEFRLRLADPTHIPFRRYALINVSYMIDELCHRLGQASNYNEYAIMRAIRDSANNLGSWSDGHP